jgi:uncharacterized protein
MPTLKERIDADLKDAMRAKDELKLAVLRMMKSTIKYKEVEATATVLDDEKVVGVLTTMVKQRRDSIDEYTKANRADLADREKAEIGVIQAYMPEQLSAEGLTRAVAEGIAEAKATSLKDLGAVMKVLTPKLKGRAEGKAISDEVKAQLGKA